MDRITVPTCILHRLLLSHRISSAVRDGTVQCSSRRTILALLVTRKDVDARAVVMADLTSHSVAIMGRTVLAATEAMRIVILLRACDLPPRFDLMTTTNKQCEGAIPANESRCTRAREESTKDDTGELYHSHERATTTINDEPFSLSFFFLLTTSSPPSLTTDIASVASAISAPLMRVVRSRRCVGSWMKMRDLESGRRAKDEAERASLTLRNQERQERCFGAPLAVSSTTNCDAVPLRF